MVNPMNISYDAYRVFFYTAKYRSFTLAARALQNSQPNITRTIKNLEQALGCTLFLRNNRRVELTQDGETLYRHVSDAFEQLQAGEEALRRGGGLDGGILRITATEVALRVFLLPVLSQFRARYPGVHIKLLNSSTPAAIEELSKGLADLAFVTTPVDITGKLRSTPLTDVREVAVCGGAYPFLTGCKVTLEALSGYPMISLGEHGSTYRFYSQFFADHHVPFEPDIEAATADQILPMVKANLGIGFVPASFLSEADWGQSIYPIDLVQKLPPRQVCLVESVQQPTAAAAKELKKICFAHPPAADHSP